MLRFSEEDSKTEETADLVAGFQISGSECIL